jgi:hypothetical protein
LDFIIPEIAVFKDDLNKFTKEIGHKTAKGWGLERLFSRGFDMFLKFSIEFSITFEYNTKHLRHKK